MSTPNFPWGDPNPPGGYHIGDRVGIFFSDHERYIFDNPTGVVVAITDDCEERGFEHEDDRSCAYITVQVEASVTPGDLYLIQQAEQESK